MFDSRVGFLGSALGGSNGSISVSIKCEIAASHDVTEDIDKSRAMSSFAKLLYWPSLYSLSNTLSRQCLVVTLGVDQCWFAAGTPLQRRSAPGEPPLLVRVQLSGGSCDESVPQPHLGAVPAPA